MSAASAFRVACGLEPVSRRRDDPPLDQRTGEPLERQVAEMRMHSQPIALGGRADRRRREERLAVAEVRHGELVHRARQRPASRRRPAGPRPAAGA